MSRLPRGLALIAAGLLIVAGCTPSDAACAAASVTLEATVTDEAMDPSALAVCRGQQVTLELRSETDGVFHLHGFDDQLPATSLTPGQSSSLAFTANVAGQFIIELHARSGGSSLEIGVLTVNEP